MPVLSQEGIISCMEKTVLLNSMYKHTHVTNKSFCLLFKVAVAKSYEQLYQTLYKWLSQDKLSYRSVENHHNVNNTLVVIHSFLNYKDFILSGNNVLVYKTPIRVMSCQRVTVQKKAFLRAL